MFLGRGVRINSQNIYSFCNKSFFSWHPVWYDGATPLTLLIIFDLLNIFALLSGRSLIMIESRVMMSLPRQWIAKPCSVEYRRTHARTVISCVTSVVVQWVTSGANPDRDAAPDCHTRACPPQPPARDLPPCDSGALRSTLGVRLFIE